MTLSEKIMKLRKENAWTREDFASKLNVEKQIIAEWESGQMKPDAESLNKIASALKTSVDELLDENENPIRENYSREKSKKDRGKRGPVVVFILIMLLIIAVIGIFLTILNKVYNIVVKPYEQRSIIEVFEEDSLVDIFKNVPNQIIEITDTISFNMQAPKKRMENLDKSFKANSFNNMFEALYSGKVSGHFMSDFIEEVIKSNQKNPFHIITISFDGVDTSDADTLRSMEDKIDEQKSYYVTFDYSVDSYIKKATIQLKEDVQ